MIVRPFVRPWLAVLAFASVSLVACSRRTISESVVGSAMRQQAFGHDPVVASGSFVLLAGDMHCHVAPPDSDADVTRDFPETVTLAKDHHLDFVVFTPHVPSRFYMNTSTRDAVSRGQRELRATIANAKSDGGDGGVIFVPGFEYTDDKWGHVGVAFADLDAVLADVSLDDADAHPEKFFESWVAHGGTLVVNHPFVTPLDSVFHMARVDLSWKAWTKKKTPPPEISALDRLATGIEAYNAQVTHLRDAILLGDSNASIDKTMKKLESLVVAERRRIAPTGGSDSHGPQLAATTWLLAESKTVEGVRKAFVEGRTCVRSPNACSFEVKVGETWGPIGTSVNGVDGVDVRANGKAIEIFAQGEIVARPAGGEAVRVATKKDVCSVLTARVDEGMSAPIYVNCF